MRAAGTSRVQYQSPLRDRRSHERGTSTSSVTTASMYAPCRSTACSAAQRRAERVEGTAADAGRGVVQEQGPSAAAGRAEVEADEARAKELQGAGQEELQW